MHKKNPAKLIQGCIFTIFILRSDADVKKKQKTFEVTFKFPKLKNFLFFNSLFGRYGILIFSCSLFVLFDLFFQNHGILMEKENLIFLIDPYHYATLWLVCGFVANNSLHLKIA